MVSQLILDECDGEFGCNCPTERKKLPRGSRAKHGTRARYQYGCRCPECCDANRDYGRAWRAAHPQAKRSYRVEGPRKPPPHGTLSRYKNQKCRCDLCREANRLRRRQEQGILQKTTNEKENS